jgi:hypothetical protein
MFSFALQGEVDKRDRLPLAFSKPWKQIKDSEKSGYILEIPDSSIGLNYKFYGIHPFGHVFNLSMGSTSIYRAFP